MTPGSRRRGLQPNLNLIACLAWCAGCWALVVHLLVALAG
jgi:hypothetical protein